MTLLAPLPGSVRILALTADQRSLLFHEAGLAGLLLLAVLAAGGFVLLFFSIRKKRSDVATRTPWASAADVTSMELLARASAAQSEALAVERSVRRKAQDDANFKDVLLTRSMEDRVKLARDLHDGIIQSLYAAGLSLESARRLITDRPQEAETKLADAVKTLNHAIRDVRTCLAGLDRSPTATSDFRAGLEIALDDLRRAHAATLDLRIDPEAGQLLTAEQVPELLQIAREAASNALRHGHASAVTLRLQADDRELCLLVQDNGRGFVHAAAAAEGRGLANMQGRAAALGGTLRVTSRPGDGTRVVLLIPLAVIKSS